MRGYDSSYYAATLLSFWKKQLKFRTIICLLFLRTAQYILITHPVFKVREIPASSATSESASETRRGTPGRPEGTSAHWSSSASAGTHEASATVTSSASSVSQWNAECLRIHSSLFCPGRPSLPKTNRDQSGPVCLDKHETLKRASQPKMGILLLLMSTYPVNIF